MPQPQMEICKVCLLLDNDSRLKPCLYCSLCSSWLCDACRGDWWRRTVAAARENFYGIRA